MLLIFSIYFVTFKGISLTFSLQLISKRVSEFMVMRRTSGVRILGVRHKQGIAEQGEVPLLSPPASPEFHIVMKQQGALA